MKREALFKKIILTIALTVTGFLSHSQFIYKDKFDAIESNINASTSGVLYAIKNAKFSSNALTLADAESYVLRSYLAMYKATHDMSYLGKFVEHSRYVIQQRGVGRTDGKKCFTDAVTNYVSVLRNGQICYPLVEFAYLVNVEETSLGSLNMPYAVSYFPATYFTYGSYATFLIQYVEDVVEVFDESHFSTNPGDNIDCWYSPGVNGYYRPDTTLLENNIQCAMGLTLYKLYQLTSTADYLSKTKTTADRFSNMLSLVGNHYEWKHRWPGVPTNEVDWEDLDHGSIEIELAWECYRNGIKIGTDSIFTKTDIDRLARSVTESAYSSPSYLYFTVHGDNDWWKPAPEPLSTAFQVSAGRWLYLSESIAGNNDYLGRDIFYIAAYNAFKKFTYLSANDPVPMMTNLANLCYYQSKGYSRLNFIDRDTTYGSLSNWAGVAIGNLEGTDKHMVTVRNYDGDFFISKAGGTGIQYLASYTAPGSGSQWAGVATGNFDNSGKDEFVAVRNVDGDFFMYKYASGTTTSFKTYSEPSNSNWKGIAAGDFNGDGIDEFVAVRNLDSKIMLYNYNTSTGNITFMDDQVVTGAIWAGVAAGDFDNNGDDEIATIETNGKISIYDVNSSYAISNHPITHTQPTSTWDAITAGDFGTGVEIVAHRQDNGDFYYYRLESGVITFKHHDYFTSGQLNSEIAAGRFTNATTDDFVYLRNLDAAWILCSVDPITTANSVGQSFKWIEEKGTPNREEMINVYPNPASQQLTIEGSFDREGILNITMISTLGQEVVPVVNRKTIAGKNIFTIDIGDRNKFKPGIYFLKLTLDGTPIETKRIMIQ